MTSIDEKMASNPEFAEKEHAVRDLETKANQLAQRVSELTRKIADFERQFAKLDISSPQALHVGEALRRAKDELAENKTTLADLRKQIASTTAERDALLENQS